MTMVFNVKGFVKILLASDQSNISDISIKYIRMKKKQNIFIKKLGKIMKSVFVINQIYQIYDTSGWKGNVLKHIQKNINFELQKNTFLRTDDHGAFVWGDLWKFFWQVAINQISGTWHTSVTKKKTWRNGENEEKVENIWFSVFADFVAKLKIKENGSL